MPVVAAAVTVASVGDVDELARAWMTPATADWANSGIKEIKERMLIVEPPADEILFKDCGVNFQDWISWVRPSKGRTTMDLSCFIYLHIPSWLNAMPPCGRRPIPNSIRVSTPCPCARHG